MWFIYYKNVPSVVLQYDPEARMIVVDVKKPMGDRKTDLTHMAYYMEKDVRCSHLFCFFVNIWA